MQVYGFRSYVLRERERERVTTISREKIVPTVFSLGQKVMSKLVAFLKMKQLQIRCATLFLFFYYCATVVYNCDMIGLQGLEP